MLDRSLNLSYARTTPWHGVARPQNVSAAVCHGQCLPVVSNKFTLAMPEPEMPALTFIFLWHTDCTGQRGADVAADCTAMLLYPYKRLGAFVELRYQLHTCMSQAMAICCNVFAQHAWYSFSQQADDGSAPYHNVTHYNMSIILHFTGCTVLLRGD
jgi:hypothetical protein